MDSNGPISVDPYLRDLTRAVRRFLERHWAAWHRHEGSPDLRTLSQGTCGRSSLFLIRVLQKAGFEADFAAGDPTEGQKGFHAPGGWKGHAWVESGGLIIDVTADQFGLPPVVITEVGDACYRRGTDTTKPEFIHIRQRVVRELLEDWVSCTEGRIQDET